MSVTAKRLALFATAAVQLVAAVRPQAGPQAPSRAEQKSADTLGSEGHARSLAELVVKQEYGHPDHSHKQNTKNQNTKGQLQTKVAEVGELLKKLKFMESQKDRRQSLIKQRKLSLDLEKVRNRIKQTWHELYKAENLFKNGPYEGDDALSPMTGQGSGASRASPLRRMDGSPTDEDLHFEDEGGKLHGGGRSAGEKDHARCCRCGPYWSTPFDTAIWSASGQCDLQCEQLFHTEPDETILPAPNDCHIHARTIGHQQRSDCRDECRNLIWRHYGAESFPADGPAKCVGSGCEFEVDPGKLQKLFDHAEEWWKKHGEGDSPRPAGQCDTWLKNDVCKHHVGFMKKTCPGKCGGDRTVDEGGLNTAGEHDAVVVRPNHTDEKAEEEEEVEAQGGSPALTDWNMVFITLVANTFVLPALLSMACGTCWCLRPGKATEITDSSSD